MSDTHDLIRPENEFASARGGQGIFHVFMRTKRRSSHKLPTRFDSLASLNTALRSRADTSSCLYAKYAGCLALRCTNYWATSHSLIIEISEIKLYFH